MEIFPVSFPISAFQIIVSAILSIIVTIFFSIHIWLRSTVGKFESDDRMDGKTVLITGGNSGLGLETVRDLLRRGARIIMASRKIDVANRVRDALIKETGNDKIVLHKVDLSSQKSVREFAGEILATEKKIDVLIHNSGCASTFNKRKSVDGIEMTMATNHYGPFLLTHLLIDLIKASNCRIVIVSSAYYKVARVDLNNLNPLDGFPFKLYYVTKTANIMFGLELAKRLEETTKVNVFMVNPGMCNTAIFKKVPFPLNLVVKNSFKTPQEGAETIIMAAVSKKLYGETGKYLSDCQISDLWSFVKNEEKNRFFWEASKKICGLRESDPKI